MDYYTSHTRGEREREGEGEGDGEGRDGADVQILIWLYSNDRGEIF